MMSHRPLPAAATAIPLHLSRRTFVENVLPLLTSLALHATVLLLVLLTLRVTGVIPPVFEYNRGIVTAADPVLPPGPSIEVTDPTRFNTGEQTQIAGPNHDPLVIFGDPKSKHEEMPWNPAMPKLDPGGSSEGTNANFILQGLNTAPGKISSKTHGLGDGDGDGIGDGTGNVLGPDVGRGDPNGGDINVKTTYLHLRGQRTIFLLDASGSMNSSMDDLRMELRKAINSLKPYRRFNILFFQADSVAALESGNDLVPGTPYYQSQAREFIDKVVAKGKTNPIPGLELAFKQHPDYIVILTDGDFPDNAAVIKRIQELNADGKVQIDTIAFLDQGETYQKVLRQIAHENRGHFRLVKESDLEQ